MGQPSPHARERSHRLLSSDTSKVGHQAQPGASRCAQVAVGVGVWMGDEQGQRRGRGRSPCRDAAPDGRVTHVRRAAGRADHAQTLIAERHAGGLAGQGRRGRQQQPYSTHGQTQSWPGHEIPELGPAGSAGAPRMRRTRPAGIVRQGDRPHGGRGCASSPLREGGGDQMPSCPMRRLRVLRWARHVVLPQHPAGHSDSDWHAQAAY